MITEDYVSFKTAKLLKEKGFNEYCRAFRSPSGKLFYSSNDIKNFEDKKTIGSAVAAPTLQMTIKWLREVHNIDIIAPPQYDSIRWTYSAIIFKLSIPCTEIRLNDNKDKKEETCEAAIKYCLEHLI